MEQRISISDGLASHVNRFAASHDVDVDHAYELLLAVGFETLDSVDLDVYTEGDVLFLDCPDCGAVFDDPGEAVAHDCAGN